MELWHGSEVVVEHPSLDKCRQFNDYGCGFYCTPHEEMAMEWACRTESDGIANRYELDMDGLAVLDLESGEFSILNWLAILADNREFNVSTPLAREGLRYLLDNCLIDISPYDVIRGYRADDSYFSFARQFVNGMISLRQLQLIMRLGDLGIQYALMSERAFSAIRFREWRQALGSEYYPKRFKREQNARRKYLETVNGFDSEGVYIRDLMTGRVDLDDPRVDELWTE